MADLNQKRQNVTTYDFSSLSDEEKLKFLNNFVDKCLDFLDNLGPDDYLALLQEAQNLQPKELSDEEALGAFSCEFSSIMPLL